MTNGKISVLLMSLSVLVFVLLAFCVVQLTIVSVLSPRGKVLMNYNDEKELLVEENRILEQRIAERAALGVITNRAEGELDMERVGSIVYLRAPSAAAEADVSK
jgi:hypothetical protein